MPNIPGKLPGKFPLFMANLNKLLICDEYVRYELKIVYMKKLFLQETGFSLVQGMILAAALAGSALVATRLLSDQKLSLKSMETRDQIEDLHNIIYSTLQNRENCEATFVQNFSPNIMNALTTATSTTPLVLPDVRARIDDVTSTVVARRFIAPVNTTEAGRNTYMNGNVLINNMTMTYAAANSTATLSIIYERLNNDATKRTKQGYGAKTIRKEITLRVQRNPFDVLKPFVSCYAEAPGNNINEQFCNEMRDTTTPGRDLFVWDPTTNTCYPDARCEDHEIYRGFRANGDVVCTPLSQVINWNTVYTGTNGTCGPGKYVWIQPNADRTKISIQCSSSPPP